ncbi:hypothetical protein K456DRAFT_1785964, partial [Colletotrichum gloeosporioides 23]
MAGPAHLEEQKSVKLSTYAVFFIGTPHQGAEGVDLAQILTKVLSLFSNTNVTPLKDLKRNSDRLVELQRQYNAISHEFKTVFYYETRQIPIPLIGRRLVVPEFSAVVFGAANAEAIPLDADHSTMVKFTGPTDENFLNVATVLHLHYNKATARIRRNWENWSSIREHHVHHESSSNIGQMPKEFVIGVTFKNISNRHFTARNQTLHSMGRLLQQEPCQLETRVAVIYGPGGIGKTQLALEYVRRQQQNYGSVFWIDAHRPDTVKTSIDECVNHILSHYEVRGITNSPRFGFLKRQMQMERAKEAFLAWLAYEENKSWLLIIDNLDDPDSVSLREILPSTARGSVLVTSRRSDFSVAWNSIQIPVMDHDEALVLL